MRKCSRKKNKTSEFKKQIESEALKTTLTKLITVLSNPSGVCNDTSSLTFHLNCYLAS